ncbi:MAG: HAMP domain-containing sensor histidine kinase [Candidatus Gracilibacteria bacterium]|nr:HAMP domain-containing sensor histidine kinase [Candidatus Gracilibacteria bacterium]
MFFGICLNSYFFYSWYNSEKREINENIDKIYNDSCEYKIDSKTKIVKGVLDMGGYIIDKNNKFYLSDKYKEIPKINRLGFFEINGNHFFLYGKKIDGIGEVVLFGNVTSYFHDQIFLFDITIILLIIFSIITLPISLYFTKNSLKDLNKIANFAKNLDFDNLSKTIEISGKYDDEIRIVADALNNAIRKINVKAQRLREFTGDVAHEFKTPLMSINSEIDYALKSRKYKESMDNIKIQIKSLDDIVTSLLAFARLESKKIDITEENIGDMIRSVVFEMENIYKDKQLLTELNLKEGILKKIDKNLFSVALKNLIGNAFRYTDSGNINIELDSTRIMISDSGKGIAKENIGKIFERFYKEDKSRNDSTSHGLGLSLTKEILEKHKFKIKVESEVGVGSKFIIFF